MFRRLLPLIALFALVVAPFGRAAAAEAAPATHHSAAAMAGHCDEDSAPASPNDDTRSIDCMTACATVTAAEAPAIDPVEQAAPPPVPLPVARFAGLLHGADPPPPRFS